MAEDRLPLALSQMCFTIKQSVKTLKLLNSSKAVFAEMRLPAFVQLNLLSLHEQIQPIR